MTAPQELRRLPQPRLLAGGMLQWPRLAPSPSAPLVPVKKLSQILQAYDTSAWHLLHSPVHLAGPHFAAKCSLGAGNIISSYISRHVYFHFAIIICTDTQYAFPLYLSEHILDMMPGCQQKENGGSVGNGHPNVHPLTTGDTTCRPVTRSDIDAFHPFSVYFLSSIRSPDTSFHFLVFSRC